MNLKSMLVCVLSAVMLCSCANDADSTAENEVEQTAAAEVTAFEETSAAEVTAAETTALQDNEPEIVTEFLYDLDNDGNDEIIVLEPRSHIVCYDKDGNKLGSASGQWCDQTDSIVLKWYDDGSEIYPALYSKYDVDFAHDEYYIILSLKNGTFSAERLIQWGYLRSDNGGWYGTPYVYGYYSEIYGAWVSKEKCNEYKAMVYDSIADAPSYKRVDFLKKAAKRLMEDNIFCDIGDAIAADIDNNGTDEYLLRSDGKLYCFEQVGDDAELIGETAFDEESYALEWYNDREQVFSVLRAADTYYRLMLEENRFKAELFLQTSDGKYYYGGKEISEDELLRKKYFIWDKKQNRLEYTVKAASEYSGNGILYDIESDGIPELLKELHEKGIKIATASSKPKVFIKKMLEVNGLSEFVDYVGGTLFDNKESGKTAIINNALQELGCTDKARALMVGDRKFDIDGAKGAGIKTVAVLYGFGSREEFTEHEAEYIAENTAEVRKIIFGE